MKKTLLSFLLAILFALSTLTMSQTKNWDSGALSIDLARQKQVLEDLLEISRSLVALQAQLPAIEQLIKDTPSGRKLVEVLQLTQTQPALSTLGEKQLAAQDLVLLASYIRELSNLDPKTVSLLAKVSGGRNLEDTLSATLHSKPEQSPESWALTGERVLFAQARGVSTPRAPTIILDIGNNPISLALGQTAKTPEGPVTLKNVEDARNPELNPGYLRIELETSTGTTYLYYP